MEASGRDSFQITFKIQFEGVNLVLCASKYQSFLRFGAASRIKSLESWHYSLNPLMTNVLII